MDLDTPQAGMLLTVAGLTIVVSVLMEGIKRGVSMSDEAVSRWGPLMAMGIGLIAASLTYLALVFDGAMGLSGGAIVQVFLTGLLAGAAAGGIYKATKSTSGGNQG